MISNTFIEHFINDASASHLRLYLYLLYSSQSNTSFCLEAACNFLEESEKDVLRSISYWENIGVFSVVRNKDAISSITISDSHTSLSKDVIMSTMSPSNSMADIFEPVHEDDNMLYLSETMDRISRNFEGKKGLFSTSEMEYICTLYENHGFSDNLIVSIYTDVYRANPNKVKNFNRVEQVANSLIKTNKLVMREIGATNTNVPSYLEYIYKWLSLYEMPQEVILEACRISMRKPACARFDYIDGILNNWNRAGIHTVSDISKLENRNDRPVKATKSTNKTKNRFNNFKERNYSPDDIEKMRQQLLLMA